MDPVNFDRCGIMTSATLYTVTFLAKWDAHHPQYHKPKVLEEENDEIS